jgi:hypothetical protein
MISVIIRVLNESPTVASVEPRPPLIPRVPLFLPVLQMSVPSMSPLRGLFRPAGEECSGYLSGGCR